MAEERALDLPLPEITIKDFDHAWKRFELVSAAKEWNADKQKVILPTLLRGKLLDYYVECNEETRGNLARLKVSLMKKAGLVRDSLISSRIFMERNQAPEEKVTDFVVELKKLFKEAYPTEEFTSAILLQRFLTGLSPKIRQQLLLKGKPDTLQAAVENAKIIEYALNFETGLDDNAQEVNVVHRKTVVQENEASKKLQETMEQIVKRLDALEKVKQPQSRRQPRYYSSRPPRGSHPNRETNLRCWTCGELGHLKRYCPLNYSGSAETVGGWPRQ